MFNENHLRESLKKRFDFIDFNEWKDKFIDIEFDLSVFYNPKNFIKYLIDKYGLNNKIDNIKMYITYKGNSATFDSSDLFKDKDWGAYIYHFLNSLEDVNLNCRQLNMLCKRLNLALQIVGNGFIMPDCLMCIIVKGMIKKKTIKRKSSYKNYPFSYVDKATKKSEHILKLFVDNGDIETYADTHILLGDEVAGTSYPNKTTIQLHKGEIFDNNKQAAEFAILANSQDNNANQKEKEQ